MTTAVMNPYDSPKQVTPQTSAAVIESDRAVAELQASIMIARRFRRQPKECCDRILDECKRKSLAEAALYSYPRGGMEITGPSIRLAETIARNWENIDFGIKEISQENGRSELLAYAWDLETNVKQSKLFVVEHVRHTKKGSKKLTDPRDIYETVANAGARRLRSCIIGLIPKEVMDAAVEQCERTIESLVDPKSVKKMIAAFEKIGVTVEQIEKRLQRNIKSITATQIVSLRKIYTSLKDKMSSISDWFQVGENPTMDSISDIGFDIMAKALNQDKLREYLEMIAARDQRTVDQVKSRAMATPDGFELFRQDFYAWGLRGKDDGSDKHGDSGSAGAPGPEGPGNDNGDPEEKTQKAPTVEEARNWCQSNDLMGVYRSDKQEMVSIAATSLNINTSGISWKDLHQAVKSALNPQNDEDKKELFELTDFFNQTAIEYKNIDGGTDIFRKAIDAANLKPGQRPTTIEKARVFKETYEALLKNHKVSAETSMQKDRVVEEPNTKEITKQFDEFVNTYYPTTDLHQLHNFIGMRANSGGMPTQHLMINFIDNPNERDAMFEAFNKWIESRM